MILTILFYILMMCALYGFIFIYLPYRVIRFLFRKIKKMRRFVN